MKTALLLIGFFAVAYFLFTKRKEALRKNNAFKNRTTRFRDSEFSHSQYRCVAIKTGSHACAAATQLAQQPILIESAPVLPLASCDAAKCHCKYLRYDDRRQEERRSPVLTASQIMGQYEEHRSAENRRKNE